MQQGWAFLRRNLTARVLLAIIVGAAVGYFFPATGVQLKVLADIFVKLIKMVIAPVVFLTITMGIAGMGDMKKIGRIGGKALLYFEIITTFALAVGLLVISILRPGNKLDIKNMQSVDVTQYTSAAPPTFTEFLLGIIPDSVVGALAKGELLPVLFFAVLFGLALAKHPQHANNLLQTFQRLSDVFFSIVGMIMTLSPLAALGAMAYTVGKFGIDSLAALADLMITVYATMALFVFVVLGLVARLFGFRILRLLAYIKDELLLVLGTSSSESVLPNIMDKLARAGCAKSVVGLVIPTGYSFNLDGTSIYLSMATLFIAQAYGVDLSAAQIITIFAIMMLTSKGAAGVTGSGFVTLAATLAAIPGHLIPVEGIALVLGVDRFMSEARAITNIIGNTVATVVIAKSEGEFTDTGLL